MASAEIFETEQKYDADASTLLPALLEIPGVKRAAEPVSDHLEAVYFDTPTLALAARRITLRRRTGGTDHGWHLKIPSGDDRRRAPGRLRRRRHLRRNPGPGTCRAALERMGKPARKLIEAAKRLQQILGDHQDSVMARAFLTRLAAGPGLPPDTDRTYLLLLAVEERIARDTEARYRKAARKKAISIRLATESEIIRAAASAISKSPEPEHTPA